MRIFNELKTQELNEGKLDFERGYLEPDKLFVVHHEAVVGKSAEEIAEELIAQGVECNRRFDDNWYKTTKVYENGGSDEEPISPVEAKDAWDEYEDIQVFVPYTEEELEERHLARLRAQRVNLLEAFDKWEKAVLRGRESDDIAVMEWYKRLLDLDGVAFEHIPSRIQYYIG